MTNLLLRFLSEDCGQDIVEYSLLLTFIGIACMWCLGWGHASVATVWGAANSVTARATAAARGNGG
jgi:Flp pilus assembly pilin Flp